MNENISYASSVSTFLPDIGQSRVEICTRLYNYTVSKLLYKHLVGLLIRKYRSFSVVGLPYEHSRNLNEFYAFPSGIFEEIQWHIYLPRIGLCL